MLCRTRRHHRAVNQWVTIYLSEHTQVWEPHWVCADCAEDLGLRLTEETPMFWTEATVERWNTAYNVAALILLGGLALYPIFLIYTFLSYVGGLFP